MPMPRAITKFNRSVLNKGMVRLTGHGPLVEIEHVGRHSGRTYRTPMMAFRKDETVTIALTYGPEVDWLANISAAGGCRMHLGDHLLTLGAPVRLGADEGLARMPLPARALLPILGCDDYIELAVLAEESFTGWE